MQIQRVGKPHSSCQFLAAAIPDLVERFHSELVGAAKNINIAVKTTDSEHASIFNLRRHLFSTDDTLLRQGPPIDI